jgi:hypothetical protein
MSRALDRSAAEAQIVEDDTPQEVGSMPASEAPRSEPVRVDADTVEFSASLGAVLGPPGGVIESDVQPGADDYVEYEVRPLPTGGGVAVPVDGERPPSSPTDRQPGEATLGLELPQDDTATHDAERRAAAAEGRRSERESELRQQLAAKKRELEIAKVSRAASDLERRMA